MRKAVRLLMLLIGISVVSTGCLSTLKQVIEVGELVEEIVDCIRNENADKLAVCIPVLLQSMQLA